VDCFTKCAPSPETVDNGLTKARKLYGTVQGTNTKCVISAFIRLYEQVTGFFPYLVIDTQTSHWILPYFVTGFFHTLFKDENNILTIQSTK